MDNTTFEINNQSETTIDTSKLSPMMVQWHACKQVSKNAILLFRLGDFYEAFYEDAQILSRELDLTLTKRQDVPMSGIPHHTSDAYIDRLVAKGFRVAVAEQMEDPSQTKGIVKREVVRVVTPGTVVNSGLLSDKANNYIASLSQVGNLFGLAFLDLTTAEFRVIELNNERDLLNELHRIRPVEFLISNKFREKNLMLFSEMEKSFTFLVNPIEDWHFDPKNTTSALLSHFKVHSLDGFGLKLMIAAINSAGALLPYLRDNLCLSIDHITTIEPYSNSSYMSLDRVTLRNLELTESLNDGSRKNTLLEILDQTRTPMGARLMRQWIKQPLLSVDEISRRQHSVQAFFERPIVLEKISELLEDVRDIERLMMKVCTGYANPKDLVALRTSFIPLGELKSILSQSPAELTQNEALKLDTLPGMTQLIANALVDEPPLKLGDGNVIREGFHKELDDLRSISRDSKAWLARYQTQLRDTTGIKTIKVGYTKMFGYYIEVSRGQSEKMPESFQRRQTLVNAERYITPELKDFESKVLTAEERMYGIENELFDTLRIEVSKYANQVSAISQAVAKLDCMHSLAKAARQYDYIKPEFTDEDQLIIEDGRHPVIEASCGSEKFVPNDTHLDNQNNRLFLITGPNMAGKSTYIRQVALIVIMAQIGSFVPAKTAKIGIIDKVFTRIGASDDLSRGQSTFMVEMTETANILNNATSRSLVILDEIGRGTSTYDGISIAWSVAEYLLVTEGKIAKTLFATHYWELTKLEEKVPGAVNYNVAVHESEDGIIFLRKIVRGGTDKSYGIHVARLAGLPTPAINRAKEILVHLEENANRKSAFEPSKPKRSLQKPKAPASHHEIQLSLFG